MWPRARLKNKFPGFQSTFNFFIAENITTLNKQCKKKPFTLACLKR